MTPRHVAAVVTVLAAAPAVAGAQVCTGLAPFERGPMQATATVAKMHGVINVDGGIAVGSRTAFARLSAGRNSLQGREKSGLAINGSGGVEFPGGPRQTVRMCLLGALGITAGPRDVVVMDPAGTPVRMDLSSVDWSLGVATGANRSLTRRPLLLPTGSIVIVSTTTRARNTYSGTVSRAHRVFGVMEAGVGVVVARTITIRPMITIPVGLPRASYGATVTVSTALGGG